MRNLIQRRGTWIAAVAAVAAIAASVLAGRPPAPTPSTAPASSGTSPAAPTAVAAVGPVMYYEVLDADASVLMERRLDGVSLARRVAARPDGDVGRTWTIDPSGTVAISGVADGQVTHLAAVAIADGTQVWTADIPVVQLEQAVWSADGRRVAMIARPEESGPSAVQVLDVRDGRLARAVIPDAAVVQGFDAADGVILRERGDTAESTTWRFLRMDPATNVVAALREIPAIGPATSGTDDVAPARGIAVTLGLAPNDEGAAVLAMSLSGGVGRSIATFASVDALAIDPSGSGVAIAANDAIRFVTWDGTATDLWHGTDPVSAFAWSADGRDLVVSTYAGGGSIALVERTTGRIVDIPRPPDIADMLFVGLVGDMPLPEVALPAEPTPVPTPGPSGADLAGAPAVAAAWVEAGTGSLILHAERLVPTSAGGMRVTGSMTPVELGPADENTDASVRVVPRPGTADVLLWVDTGNRAEGWLWDGRSAARRLVLPKDWPVQGFDVAWRPDGGAIAASADLLDAAGDDMTVFVVAGPGALRTTVIHATHDYTQLQGWWSSTALQVGHAVCTEGCPGRYASSARQRLSDGRLTLLGPADRGHGVVDEVFGDGHGGLLMTAINGDTADDVTIDWPLGGSPGGPQFVGWAVDRRSLVVASETPAGLDLYRIDDPARRAVHGRLTDPMPTSLGHLAHRVLDVHVSADGRWATTTDRTRAGELVELASGRRWPLTRDRVIEWWPSA